MNNKFTPDQFNTLVKIQENKFDTSIYFPSSVTFPSLSNVIKQNNPELANFIDNNELYDEAVAIVNPITREIAKKKFVGEEPRYIFSKLIKGIRHYVNFDTFDQSIFFSSVDGDYLRESDLKEWGLDLSTFDKSDEPIIENSNKDGLPF